MHKDKEQRYQVYHTILSISLTWALIMVCNQYLELRINIFLTAIYSIIPVLLIYFFDLNKKNIASYLLLICIIPLLALIFIIKKLNPIVWTREFTHWCITYNGSQEFYLARYANFALFGMAILIALVFYVLTKKQTLKILLAMVIMILLVVLSINKVDLNKAVVGISFFYILTIIVELYGIIYGKKAGRVEKKEGILYLAPICLILALLSVSLPSKAQPIRWTVVKRAYHQIVNQLEVWETDLEYYFGKNKNEFSISMTGYSEDGGNLQNTGEKLTEDSTNVLKVSGLGKDDRAYLIGSVSNIYSGSRWEKKLSASISGQLEYAMDYAELNAALSRQNIEILENNRLIDENNILIEYNKIKTKTFFYPLKTSKYVMLSNYNKINSDTAQISFKKGRGKGTSYRCSYYELNLQSDAFKQILRDANSFSYDNVPNLNSQTIKWMNDNNLYKNGAKDLITRENLYQILGERAKLIKEQYMNLPEELPDRVRELAVSITEDYLTNYDKLKAIEAYLLGYSYTLNPPKVPKGEDFTDYFLFESKEGYCTSFATAMAVLSRCIGIPSRYIEGFVAEFDNQGEEDFYNVKNSQAHAWTEAYIEGVGWIPFEATAPFYEARYTAWADMKKNSYATGSGIVYPSYIDHEDQSMYQGENELILAEKEDKSIGSLNGIIIFFAALGCLLLTTLIYYHILKHRYNKAFHEADYSKRMYMLFLRIIQLLKGEGFVLQEQETILMLARRVKRRFYYDQVSFMEIASIYMRYRYAEEEITKAELDQVSVFCQGLMIKKREEERRIKIWFEEFLFLIKRGNR